MYLSNGSGYFELRKEHQYYYKVQLEMYVTTLGHCGFVVWTPNECFVVQVPINMEFLRSMVERCDQFWKSSI